MRASPARDCCDAGAEPVGTTGNSQVGVDTIVGGVNSVTGTNQADSYDAHNFTSANFGFNQFEGRGGNDNIIGNGQTQIAFFAATNGVTVDLGAGSADGDGSVGHDTFTGVNSVFGSNFNDIISGDANSNVLYGSGGNDRLDGRSGDDLLFGGTGSGTFAYQTGGGADTIGDFNAGQGDLIDLTGVVGVHDLANVQAISTQIGADTVIDFGGGNKLTLSNVALADLVAGDFVFNTDNAPAIAGDLSLTLSKGGSVTLTTVDLRAVDSDDTVDELTFTASGVTNGHLAFVDAPGTPITQFTEADLEAGEVMFVHDGSATTGASFAVSVTDAGGLTSAPTAVSATVSQAEANLWRDVQFPSVLSGRHIFTPNVQFNSLASFVADLLRRPPSAMIPSTIHMAPTRAISSAR